MCKRCFFFCFPPPLIFLFFFFFFFFLFLVGYCGRFSVHSSPTHTQPYVLFICVPLLPPGFTRAWLHMCVCVRMCECGGVGVRVKMRTPSLSSSLFLFLYVDTFIPFFGVSHMTLFLFVYSIVFYSFPCPPLLIFLQIFGGPYGTINAKANTRHQRRDGSAAASWLILLLPHTHAHTGCRHAFLESEYVYVWVCTCVCDALRSQRRIFVQ